MLYCNIFFSQKKTTQEKKVATISEKMDFLGKEEHRIKFFLFFSYKLSKDPWCDDAEDSDHDLKFSNTACTEIRFFLLIMEEFIKQNISKEKNNVIIRCLKYPKVFEQIFNCILDSFFC